jgi:hypothetical protein
VVGPPPADPNQPLWVRLWHYDVDDPSSNQPSVDNEGMGPDNRGLGWWAMAGQGGGNYSEVPVTATGHAASVFDVSPKPGDNFRVNAQIVGQGMYGITVPQGVSDGRILRSDTQQPPRTEEVTPMLTAWRRFHVERDSMSAPVSYLNTVEGRIQSVQPFGPYWIITASYWSLDHVLQINRFVPGKMMEVATGLAYSVVSNTAEVAGCFAVATQGGPMPNVGDAVDLYDDDFDLNPSPPSVRPGILPQLPDCSIGQTAFRSGYVEVLGAQSGWNQSNKAFYPYLRTPNLFPRESSGKGRSLFWIGYILGEFQYDQSFSNDPDAESAQMGALFEDSVTREKYGAAVWFETIRDRSYEKVRATGHELAHFFDANHDTFEGQVLAVDPQLPNRHFLVAGDLLGAGLLIQEQVSKVDILDAQGQEEGTDILAADVYDAGNTWVWLLNGFVFPVQVGRTCRIWSISLLGQDGNVLTPRTMSRIRSTVASPMK